MGEIAHDAATFGFQSLLQAAGLQGPNGAPITEALALVLAGGVGFGSVAAPSGSPVRWFVSGRHNWHGDLAYLREAITRVGLSVFWFEHDHPTVLARALANWLEAPDACVLAWVDAAELPWHGLSPAWQGLAPRVVVLRGADAQRGVRVEDLGGAARLLPHSDLAAARQAITKHHGRIARLTEERPAVDVPRALVSGLRASAQGLCQGHGDVQGLPALRVWAERLAQGDGFLVPFPLPTDILPALLDLHRAIRSGDGLLRECFADGVAEAAALLRHDALAAHRQVWRELGRSWTDIADRCLPQESSFAALQQLAEQVDQGVSAGAAASDQAAHRRDLNTRLLDAAQQWQPESAALRAHLRQLGRALAVLALAEQRAAEQLLATLNEVVLD